MKKKSTRRKLKLIVLICLLLFAIVSLALLMIPPPIDGYYRCEVVEILDGSDGFLHLDNGKAFSVNLGGVEDVREFVGDYSVDRASRTITITSSRSACGKGQQLIIGWIKLQYIGDPMEGEPPIDKDLSRVLSPFLRSRLNKVEIPLGVGVQRESAD